VTRRLVFIHGIGQARKDAASLKKDWIGCLSAGLAKSGLSFPLDEDQIAFPYYGDTLNQLVSRRKIARRSSAGDPEGSLHRPLGEVVHVGSPR
jgi:hypothetical protein